MFFRHKTPEGKIGLRMGIKRQIVLKSPGLLHTMEKKGFLEMNGKVYLFAEGSLG